MSAPEVERPRVIRRKIIVPDIPAGAVPRERLDRLFCQLVDAHRVVAVTATAGAGKSVAVAPRLRSGCAGPTFPSAAGHVDRDLMRYRLFPPSWAASPASRL
jgi:hypothetical protein